MSAFRYTAFADSVKPADHNWGKEFFVEVVLAKDYDALLAERDALAKDAARYRVLRLHVAPINVCDSMGVECVDIPCDQSIEERIDELCDAQIAAPPDAGDKS